MHLFYVAEALVFVCAAGSGCLGTNVLGLTVPAMARVDRRRHELCGRHNLAYFGTRECPDVINGEDIGRVCHRHDQPALPPADREGRGSAAASVSGTMRAAAGSTG